VPGRPSVSVPGPVLSRARRGFQLANYPPVAYAIRHGA
jgi:hypothetical protein